MRAARPDLREPLLVAVWPGTGAVAFLAAAKRRAALALALVTTGCVSVHALEPHEPVQLEQGQAMAFGRVRVFEGERELTPWNVDLAEELIQPGDPDVRLALLRVESEERALYPVLQDDGWFAWSLPGGTWLVYRSSEGEPIWHDVLGAFQVHFGSDAQYLGELELHVEVTYDRYLAATGYSVLSVGVRSDPEAARGFLAQRHPTLVREPSRSRRGGERLRALAPRPHGATVRSPCRYSSAQAASRPRTTRRPERGPR